MRTLSRVCMWGGLGLVVLALAVTGYTQIILGEIQEKSDRFAAEERALEEAGAPPERLYAVSDAHQNALEPDYKRLFRFRMVSGILFIAGLILGPLGAFLRPAKRKPRTDTLPAEPDEAW